MHSNRKRRFAVLGLMLLLAAIFGSVAALRNDNKSGTITAPTGEGSPAVGWEGTVPPGSGSVVDTCVDGVNAYFYTLTIDGIDADYYDTHVATLAVRLDWDPTGGVITTQDIAAFIQDSSGTTLTSSDGGSNSEFMTVGNPEAGDYTIIACAFAVALTQPFIGQASLNVELTEGSEQLPPPDVDHGYEFSAVTIVDPQRDVAEPSLRIDGNYNVYACGPFGASRAAEYAQKSSDRGDTFRILGTPPEGRIATGGGGDCELAVGTDPNGNGEYTLAYTGLEALVNFSHSRSEDAGGSFIGSSAAVAFAGVDRQWMEGVYDDTIYLGYNAIAAGYQVVRSDDGGLTYNNPPVTAVSELFRPGPIRIDHDPSHNPAANNEIVYFTFTRADGVWIARSYDRGATWTEHEVASGFNPNNLFSGLAIDTAGNLYTTWTEKGSFNVYYAYSLRPTDNSAGAGDTWSDKRLVNREPVYSTAMPWIEAGAPGKIAVTYYGTESDGNIELGTFRAYWHVYLSTSFNALEPLAADVDFGLTQVTRHVIHWDSICLSGLGCNLSTPEGDRTLLDFFQNRIAPDGTIHVVYNQSNKIPRQPLGRIAIVSYSKQIAGPSLFDGPAPTPDPRPVLRDSTPDPDDDSLFPISTFGPTAPTPNDVEALNILNMTLTPVDDVVPGTFEISLELEDLSTIELTNALADMNSGTLLYVVRWFAGIEAHSVTAAYSAATGWEFGYSDLAFATVTGTKLETYPTTEPITAEVDGNTIRFTVQPDLFQVIDLPSKPEGAPSGRDGTVGDVIHSVTAFTFGNPGPAPDGQEYLNQADSTAPFDYEITSIPTAVNLARPANTSTQFDGSGPQALPSPEAIAGLLLVVMTAGASLYLTLRKR